MDDLYSPSTWIHQEIIDEMRQNLKNTLFELETLKMKTNEKSITHTQEINELLTLLKSTRRERDEAIQELSNSRFSYDESSSSSSSELSTFFNVHQSQPLDIFEDPTADKNQYQDPLLDFLVMGRAFPETGKLLKAVVEAGPLLQTLLVAGPLPNWVNPPPPPPPPQTQTQRFELPLPPPTTSLAFEGFDVESSVYGGSDSVTCSGSVMRFGFGSMLTGKRQRLD
ncbi:unnamed protein product [Cochlearia groenlandica]